MSKRTHPIPVRLDETTASRVKRASKRLGSNSSAVIRLALITQLDAIETGVLRIPTSAK